MRKLTVVLLCLFLAITSSVAVADFIPGNNIPAIIYNTDNGLLLLDPDGLAVTRVRISFPDNANHFFDNSPSNPLFASYGGLIPNWEFYDVGENVLGESLISSAGYDGPIRPWGQISSGLDSEDFGATYYWFGDYNLSETYAQTDITIIPEPATVILFGLGGLLLRKKPGHCDK